MGPQGYRCALEDMSIVRVRALLKWLAQIKTYRVIVRITERPFSADRSEIKIKTFRKPQYLDQQRTRSVEATFGRNCGHLAICSPAFLTVHKDNRHGAHAVTQRAPGEDRHACFTRRV